MKQLIILSLLILNITNCKMQKQTNTNPQKDIKTAVSYAIKLLETDQHETMLKKFIDPKTVANITKDLGFEVVVKKFKKKKADELLKVLKSVENKTPEYNDDKTEATFKLEEGISHKKTMEFKKFGDLWYIAN